MTEKIKVLIFGSCVSRDPFGHKVESNSDIDIIDYYARSSMASLATKSTSDLNLSKNPSAFQRKMVDRDLKKSFLVELGSLEFDILVVDFIDDRLNLLITKNGHGITDSSEFRKANVILSNSISKRLTFNDSLYREYWLLGWKLFIQKLISIGRLESLLINRVFYANKDDHGLFFPNQDYIASSNKYLSWVYEQVSLDVSDYQFLEYSHASNENPFIGRADHKWGRSPFHYTLSLEQACLNGVRNFYNRDA